MLGRALAHEVGHLVLASKAHTRAGLMAANYRPEQTALGPRGAFRLPDPEAAFVRRTCAGTGAVVTVTAKRATESAR